MRKYEKRKAESSLAVVCVRETGVVVCCVFLCLCPVSCQPAMAALKMLKCRRVSRGMLELCGSLFFAAAVPRPTARARAHSPVPPTAHTQPKPKERCLYLYVGGVE